MAHEVKIPTVGESITSASIGEWHKKDGEAVKAGDVILTIETDKISTEIEAGADGVLHHQAAEGDEVDIGAVVATIDESGAPASGGGDSEAKDEPKAEDKPEAEAGDDDEAKKSAPVSPSVRKIAEEMNVDLSSVEGSGKEGAITKADIESVAKQQEDSGAEAKAEKEEPSLSVVPAPAEKEKPKVDDSGRVTRKKLSPLRKKIATHLVNAQNDAAHLTTFNECDMGEVMSLRKQIQDSFVQKHGVKLGFMSFFIKAVVDGLKAVPQINARLEGDELVTNHFYDIGVAVGTEKGLIVPVIRDCDKKSFAEIEKDIIDYATKAREGKIQFEDLQGGVFTISNGGIYGSLLSTPILNPPQSGILGMHSIQQRPMAVNGQVVIRPMMYLALSYDHRIVDGKEAVTFLVRVKDCIEQPTRLLVGA